MKRIKELFENHAPLTEFKKENDFIYCFFSVKDKEYVIVFYDTSPQVFNRTKQMFNLSFSKTIRKGNYGIAFGLLNENFDKNNALMSLMQQNFTDRTSYTGDVFLVFSTVGYAIVKFVREYRVNALYFGAQEENRYTLYPTLAKKLASVLNMEIFEENRFYMVYKSNLDENRIKELFDSPYLFSKDKEDSDFIEYSFNVPNLPTYKVKAEKLERETISPRLHFGYYMEITTQEPINGFSFNFYQDESQKITNTGNASRIFSTVGKILEEVISYLDADFFFFESVEKEESRVRLYETLSKLIVKVKPEYAFEQFYSDGMRTYMYFMYKKDKISLKDNY